MAVGGSSTTEMQTDFVLILQIPAKIADPYIGLQGKKHIVQNSYMPKQI